MQHDVQNHGDGHKGKNEQQIDASPSENEVKHQVENGNNEKCHHQTFGQAVSSYFRVNVFHGTSHQGDQSEDQN
jgi:hypothetical protein